MGRRFVMILTEDVAYGTKNAAWPTGAKSLQFIDYEIEPNRNQTVPLESDRMTPTFAHPGGFVASGDVKMYARPDSMGELLFYLWGAVTATIQGDGPIYRNRFTFAEGVDSFSMMVDFGKSLNALFNLGTVVKKLTLEANKGDPAIATWNCQVRNQDTSSALSTISTLPSLRPFRLTDATIVQGGTTLKAESFRIEVERDIPDDAHTSGSILLPDISEEGFRITGEMEVRFESLIQMQEFFGGSAKTAPDEEMGTLAITASFDGPPTGDSDHDSYDLDINLPTCVITSYRSSINAYERLRQTIGFEALYNASNYFDLYNTDNGYT